MRQLFWLYVIVGYLSLNAFELEVDMGSGAYYTATQGKLIYQKDFWKDSSAKIEHKNSATIYTWAEFKSDQKNWPKLRIEFGHLDTKGHSYIHIDSTDTINDLVTAIEGQLPIDINNRNYDSRLVQNTYEAYLYYEYFEKSDVPSIGIGAGVKNFNFAYSATLIEGLEFTDTGGETIPLIFLKSRYELEQEDDGVQMAFEFDGKYYIFGDSNIYDFQLKMDFMMIYNEDTDLGIEFGYRSTLFDIKGSDVDTVGGDMQTSGVFVGLVGHFR